MLSRVASEHSSVVAVVGREHLEGIKKNWNQPIKVSSQSFFILVFIKHNRAELIGYCANGICR